MKKIIMVFVIILIVAGGLTLYNKNTEKKAIETAVDGIGEIFQAHTEYSKKSNRVIVEKFLKNEEELYQLIKSQLPKLSIISDYEIIRLLSFRAYYGDTKEDFQFFDIEFKDINKIGWDKINNFNDFLSYLNRLN